MELDVCTCARVMGEPANTVSSRGILSSSGFFECTNDHFPERDEVLKTAHSATIVEIAVIGAHMFCENSEAEKT